MAGISGLLAFDIVAIDTLHGGGHGHGETIILIDKGKIIEEISDQELNERCKRHIAIKATDPQKALLVLEEKLHTENFKLLPDGTIRLYDYLDDLEKVAAVLSDAHILVTGLSVSGDTLEDYFLSKIGGSENVKSPKY